MRAAILASLAAMAVSGCDQISFDRIAATCARQYGGDQHEIYACNERRTSEREMRLAARDLQLATNEARRP